jgi:hypothetical protein
MTDPSYTTTFSVDRTPDEVFDAITNVGDWWTAEIEGSTKAVGDEFSYRAGDVHYSKIRVTELVPGQKVVWRVLDNYFSFVDDQEEWKHTEMRFELSEHDAGTEVRFTHAGLIPEFECFEVCSNAWGFYVGESLRSLITTGEGKRFGNQSDAST